MRAVLFVFLILFTFPAFAQNGEDSLAALQGELVRVGGIIRSIERNLQSVDRHLETLEGKKKDLEADYEVQREKMARLGSALVHLGRTPREAVLIRPGGPLQAARTTLLLQASLPVIEAEARSFQKLMAELEQTRSTLAKKSAEARANRDSLAGQHKKLNDLMAMRASSGAAILWQDEAKRVTALARKARSLRDFLADLDTDTPEDKNAQADFFQSLPDDEGQLPVSGIITVAYGQKNAIGAVSDGLTIETLAGSLVVAPLGGIVRYVGHFRGYGNIVIIAHKGGYYSLLGGLDHISVVEGQTIVSGEPIALLDGGGHANQANAKNRKSVYFELRQGGRPVNPSRKLPGLG